MLTRENFETIAKSILEKNKTECLNRFIFNFIK